MAAGPGLESLVDQNISIITNDGHKIVGILKGFDQATNIILDESHERVYSTRQMLHLEPSKWITARHALEHEYFKDSHAALMANTLVTHIIVFTRTGSMATLLSHYRPSSTIYAFTNDERVKQRLALYQGVVPIYMEFSDDAEETFARSINYLLDGESLKKGEYMTLVQSGKHSIWQKESTHHIQARKV